MTSDDDRGGARPDDDPGGARSDPGRDRTSREGDGAEAWRPPPRLVLASASPRRRDILRQLDLDPEVRSADVDEAYLPGESPEEHVERLAREKATAIAGALRAGDDAGGAGDRATAAAADRAAAAPILVVGGDTVVVDGDDVLVKPRDEEDAVRTLMGLSGRVHAVLSGLALVSLARDGSGPETASGVSRTEVRMRAFDEAMARSYVATGEPMDKAGSYGIQGRGAALVDAVDGDYYSVVGFPVGLFLELLARLGWRFGFGSFTPPPSTK